MKRPKEEQTCLWSSISNDTDDIKAMAKAAENPEFMVVADWSRFTSEEVWNATEESGLQVLYGSQTHPPTFFFLVSFLVMTRTNNHTSCVDSILVNGVGAVYCPSLEFLENQTVPEIQAAFAEDHVTDKGLVGKSPAVQNDILNYY